jgi:KDO2-lipid IV(A) lauroyltransferase
MERHRRNVLHPAGLDVEPGAVYAHVTAGLLDFIHLSRRSDDCFSRAVEVQGADRIGRALSAGRGVIAVTAHYGAWELIPRAVKLLGHPVGVMGRRLGGGAAESLISGLRARPGVLVIDRAGGASSLVRALRLNTAVGILIDQDTRAVDAGFVDFFGLPASTPTGPARLAIRFHVPVVPLFIRRTPRGGYVLSIEEPVDPAGFTGPEGALELTALLTSRIESWVRGDPRQWVWFHERWCRRPPGSPGLR